jgi:predicted SprT family Zn-dependent metalloprotease
LGIRELRGDDVSESIYPPESRSLESRERVDVFTYPKRCPKHGTEMRRVQKMSGTLWACEQCEREAETKP